MLGEFGEAEVGIGAGAGGQVQFTDQLAMVCRQGAGEGDGAVLHIADGGAGVRAERLQEILHLVELAADVAGASVDQDDQLEAVVGAFERSPAGDGGVFAVDFGTDVLLGDVGRDLGVL